MPNESNWILIVEDNEPSRQLLANQLHRKGFEVICAEDGEEAADIIRYCRPDCILLDLIMPKMHGHAFLSLLRASDRDLPVIVMSGVENQPDLVATMENLGIQGWISKPAGTEVVVGEINAVLQPQLQEGDKPVPADDGADPKGAEGTTDAEDVVEDGDATEGEGVTATDDATDAEDSADAEAASDAGDAADAEVASEGGSTG